MKRFLLASLSLVLLLAPASAIGDHRQLATEEVVRAEHCTARIVTSDDNDAAESHYDPRTHTLFIGTSDVGTDMIRLLILLHEIGHCHQYQEMTVPALVELYPTQTPKELNADMRSGRMACEMGIDAHVEIRKLFAWAKATFNYDGDDNHGTAAERIAAVDAGCDSLQHKTQDLQGA